MSAALSHFRRSLAAAALLAGLLASVGASAQVSPAAGGPSACPEHWVGGAPPRVDAPAMLRGLRELCASEFGNFHSALTRTGMWSGSRLTAQRVRARQELSASLRAAGERTRPDTFRPDERLPPAERAELRDYQGSGFDRGHIAPNADMSTPRAQDETFVLSNMIPQDPQNNRRLWSAVEEATRDLAARRGEAFVVTGAAFLGERLRSVGGRVLVPTFVWKAVFVPSTGESGVYWAPNDASLAFDVISLDELRRRTGVDAMPAVRVGRDRAMALPQPRMRG